MVRQAPPAAAHVVRVLYRIVLLPAVFCPLVVPVEVYVALAPRYIAFVLLIVARMLVPSLVRQPLFPLLMETPLLLKAADVAGLPLVPVQV